MIIKILVILIAVIGVFLLFVASRPGNFRMERSLPIGAPALALFDQVNNHHKFTQWNPFLKADPNVKQIYSGPDAGVGAVFNWDGNKNVGAGSATIVESKPGELVRVRMDFKRPFVGTSTVDFTFKPAGDQTVMTWAMYGQNGFMGKLASLFMDCDKLCGTQFEQGLANLSKIMTTTPVAK